MRPALPYLLVGIALCAPSPAAERRSWNQIRYVGGTVEVETSRYDNNTTLTIAPSLDSISIRIAPPRLFRQQRTLEIKPSQIVSLSAGSAAWRRAREVAGSQVPARAPSLFGLAQDSAYFTIVYEAEGKRGALLLNSNQVWQILTALGKLAGKDIEVRP